MLFISLFIIKHFLEKALMVNNKEQTFHDIVIDYLYFYYEYVSMKTMI